jgi:ABC-type branched-subunit amino acid transport system ATPase component
MRSITRSLRWNSRTGHASQNTVARGVARPDAAPSALRASDIHVSFGGVIALSGVSLELKAGEILGIIGPNGAGKTTLLNCLSGMQKPDSGSVEVGGQDMTGFQPHRFAAKGVGRTFQLPSLIRHGSVLENVLLGFHPHYKAGFATSMWGLPRSRRDERDKRNEAMSLLESLGMAGLARARAEHLAHAQRRMVELARVLAIHPSVILLDEPTSGMSGESRDAVGKLLSDIRAGGSTAQIVIEHDMSFIRSLCDRLIVINFGKVLAAGDPAEVFDDPNVRRSYLGGT